MTPPNGPAAPDPRAESTVQATVHHFDAAGHGTAVTDTGIELAFDTEAYARSGLRLLRPGQRVRLHLDPVSARSTTGARSQAGAHPDTTEAARVTSLTIVTLAASNKSAPA